MLNKAIGVVLVLASLVCTFGGYVEGGGTQGFQEFQSRVVHKPFALMLLLAAAFCLVGGVTAFRREPRAGGQ